MKRELDLVFVQDDSGKLFENLTKTKKKKKLKLFGNIV